MNILEPEPERTLSQPYFQKISILLAKSIEKLLQFDINSDKCKLRDEAKNNPKTNIYNALDQDKKVVREIMTSRKDTFTIDINDSIDSILDSIANINHSKIPIYEDSIDNIIGIIYIEELKIRAKQSKLNHKEIRNMLYNPKYIPEIKQVKELYESLNLEKNETFILVDEYGGFSGIVTTKDLMYEVEGMFYNKQIETISENEFIVKGCLSVKDFNKLFKVNIEQGQYDTLNGYIINKLGEIPNKSKDIQIKVENILFKSIKIKSTRIEEIQICILK